MTYDSRTSKEPKDTEVAEMAQKPNLKRNQLMSLLNKNDPKHRNRP